MSNGHGGLSHPSSRPAQMDTLCFCTSSLWCRRSLVCVSTSLSFVGIHGLFSGLCLHFTPLLMSAFFTACLLLLAARSASLVFFCRYLSFALGNNTPLCLLSSFYLLLCYLYARARVVVLYLFYILSYLSNTVITLPGMRLILCPRRLMMTHAYIVQLCR